MIVKVAFWLPLPYLAEIVIDLVTDTGVVIIGKFTDTVLAGTVTVAGMVPMLVLLLLKFTVAPSGGAGPVRVTVPVDCVPPLTELGLIVTELSTAAVTVKLAVLVNVPKLADIVIEVFAATAAVVTLNVAVVAPGAIVTLLGTVATPVLALLSVTNAPAAGEGPFSVTVPVDELPPRTDVGLRATELSVAAVIVKVAFLVTEP